MAEQLIDEFIDAVIERGPRTTAQLGEPPNTLGKRLALEVHEPSGKLLQAGESPATPGVWALQRFHQVVQKGAGVIIDARIHLGICSKATTVLLYIAPEATQQMRLAISGAADHEQRASTGRVLSAR